MSYLSGAILSYFLCLWHLLISNLKMRLLPSQMARMWSRMLYMNIVGALSAYPYFMMPLFRQSPSVSVRLDVFLLSPEVAIPDLFSLG